LRGLMLPWDFWGFGPSRLSIHARYKNMTKTTDQEQSTVYVIVGVWAGVVDSISAWYDLELAEAERSRLKRDHNMKVTLYPCDLKGASVKRTTED